MPTRDLEIDFEAKAAELESQSAQQVLEWALGTFHPRLYFACSFQKTSSVIAHMASQI
jgi:3'-phosphoadenosine 5'-phosphosulfate sulfotransferase (PAPS reductase)/FAD synthetase